MALLTLDNGSNRQIYVFIIYYLCSNFHWNYVTLSNFVLRCNVHDVPPNHNPQLQPFTCVFAAHTHVENK